MTKMSLTLCNHSETIDDYSTGDCICTKCGTVIGERMPIFDNQYSRDENEFQKCNVFVRNTENLECKKLEYLLNITGNAGLPDKYAFKALSLYENRSKSMSTRNRANKVLLTCSLYLTLSMEKSFFTLKELSAFTEYCPRTLAKGLKQLKLSALDKMTYPQGGSVVERICGKLEINPVHIQKLKYLVEEFQIISCSSVTPQTMAASFIYLYCKSRKLVDINLVCKISGSSTTSINRFLRENHKEISNSIAKHEILKDVL